MGYPTVHITEECMREGMQIESTGISIADKVRLLDALSATGLQTIVVGSFVSPKYTPQMAGVEDLIAKFTPVEGVRYTALVLNAKGAERAARNMPPLSHRDQPPMLFTHLCDTFVRRNTNRSQQQEIERWPDIVAGARRAGADRAALAINAAFGSNFEGPFTVKQRMDLFTRQHDVWEEAGIPVTGVLLGDPMSWCAPHTMEEQLQAIRATWPDITHFYLHLHDARGLALTTTYAALRFLDEDDDLYADTTIGGIGGCPYCGNGRATGMAATEDLVNLLNELGVETGVDLDKLIDAVWILEEILGRPVPGHVARCGPMPREPHLYDPNLHFVETFEEARQFRLGPQVAERHMYPWREPIPDLRSRPGNPRR
jgi:hydroxymethylglutaryl-CoA lyase